MFVIHSLIFNPAALHAKESLVLKGKLCQYIDAIVNPVGIRIFDLLLPSVAGLH